MKGSFNRHQTATNGAGGIPGFLLWWLGREMTAFKRKRCPVVLKMIITQQLDITFWELLLTILLTWTPPMLPCSVACLFSFDSKMKVSQASSFWRVCSWSTWQPWTVGLSWASRCVRCRSSPPNTDRCRNHLCWHTEHGGCTGEPQLNIRPYLWWKRREMFTKACQI